MAPKKKQKKVNKNLRCDQVEGERFHVPQEDVFRINWWEVFCFPYIILGRFWECFVSLCAGTNQCLIYWMIIQWIVCKITRMTTPDPIVFPYYFYMFCQVILLTLLFIFLWWLFGKTVIVPFFSHIITVLKEEDVETKTNTTKTFRLKFRRYCFRKGDIFDTSIKSGSYKHISSYVLHGIIFTAVDAFVLDLLRD